MPTMKRVTRKISEALELWMLVLVAVLFVVAVVIYCFSGNNLPDAPVDPTAQENQTEPKL